MAQQYRYHESSRYAYVQKESCSEESTESGSEEEEMSEEEVEEVITHGGHGHGHGLRSSGPQSSHHQQRYYESYGGNMKAPLNFQPSHRIREERNHYTCYEQPLYGGMTKMGKFDQERGHGAYEKPQYEMYTSTVNSHDSSHFGDNFQQERGHQAYDKPQYLNYISQVNTNDSEKLRCANPRIVSHGQNREWVTNETQYYSNFKDKGKLNQAHTYQAHNNCQPRPMSPTSTTTSITTPLQSKEPLGKSKFKNAQSPYAHELDLRSRFDRLGAC